VLEVLGVILGLLYFWLEYRASIWLWAVGIVMPAIYIVVYYEAGIYADVGINVYYLLAGLYGWMTWMRKARQEKPMPISFAPKRLFIPLTLIFLLCFAAIAAILINFTGSTVPYSDSFTTALSIIALWMLSRKYVEQWLVWIAVDVVCVWLYIYKGLYPTAGLYALYSVMAVFGYLKWRSLARYEAISSAPQG